MAQETVALAVMGMDQHENGVVAVGRILREAQMRVHYLGKLLTPSQVVDGAIAQGADVIGVSCHSWEYLTLVPALVEEVARRGINTAVIIGGSVITSKDAETMRAIGVSAVFGPASRDEEIIEAVRQLAKRQE
jgi:methylmalonyl-CoA mutase C-terminal domain/subunit